MLDNLVQSFKQFAPDFFSSYCIINGSILELDKVESMGCKEFSYKSRLSVPLKLYKYFPNKETEEDGKSVNYSIQALKDNTVFLQSPMNFDDCYDSDISIDYPVYERQTLIEYCRRCSISINTELSTNEIGNLFLGAIVKSLNEHHNYENIFSEEPKTEIEKLENRIFCKSLHLEMQKTTDLGLAVSRIILEEYNNLLTKLKSTFRVSCFTTSPFSQLMWGGSYADEHLGFCLEYTVLPTDKEFTDIFYNLFPMIYCKTRKDISEKIVTMKDKNDSFDSLWNIYFHGALRKSIDWAFQNEWRLLLPLKSNNKADYNVKFFPITKVFLGNRMPADKRKELIDICRERNIPYVGVKKNKDFFEMQECETKCENCPTYNQNLCVATQNIIGES
mgnify:CR=1 FL=1